jgi:hypothetical protein
LLNVPAKLAGCHAHLAAEDAGEMALIGEAGFLRDEGKRLIGPPHQGFRPFEPALHDVTLWPDARRLLERAAEVIGAETGHSGELGQGQPIIEMCLDVVPEAAPWLAEYLHEMMVFPKGKHDDQVDSTAQFLDWFKRPFPGQAFYELIRMQAESYRNPANPERHRVLLEGPIGTSVQTSSGRDLNVASDGTLELSDDDAQP